MGAVRLDLRLDNHSEWIKIFDPRDWTVLVPCGNSDRVDNGSEIRVDLDVGGWLVSLHGTVVGLRESPNGVVVAIRGSEREKINYLNGFVRGGLLDLRKSRRLAIRLSVTYGAVEGPATTFTKDINEEGLFLFTDHPLPETSQIHMFITVPGLAQPLSVVGRVSHTILSEDEEPPGMGVVFDIEGAQRDALNDVVLRLERELRAGKHG